MTKYLGIIDRGVGGLGFYRRLREQTQRPVLYFADSGYPPYGQAPGKRLRQRLNWIINFLQIRGADRIVLACNAASAAYEENDNIRGMLSFGVSSTLKADSRDIAVIAGESTVKSNVYAKLFANHGIRIRQRVAQPLSIHIENGHMLSRQFDDDLKKILAPIRDKDVLLMACTHYPAVKEKIADQMKTGCQLIDPVEDLVAWVQQNWPETKAEHGDTQFYCSGNLQKFTRSSQSSFQVTPEILEPAPYQSAQHIDVYPAGACYS